LDQPDIIQDIQEARGRSVIESDRLGDRERGAASSPRLVKAIACCPGSDERQILRVVATTLKEPAPSRLPACRDQQPLRPLVRKLQEPEPN
jgi:hypothetical protein